MSQFLDQRGKGEEKLATLSFFSLNADASAMGENNFPRDAETQSGPLIATFRDAEEFVENSAA